jgi:hypothetical protein
MVEKERKSGYIAGGDLCMVHGCGKAVNLNVNVNENENEIENEIYPSMEAELGGYGRADFR